MEDKNQNVPKSFPGVQNNNKILKPIPQRTHVKVPNQLPNRMVGTGSVEYANNGSSGYPNAIPMSMPTDSCTLNAIIAFLGNQNIQTPAPQGLCTDGLVLPILNKDLRNVKNPKIVQAQNSELCGNKRQRISEDDEIMSNDSGNHKLDENKSSSPKKPCSNKREKNRQAAIECRRKRKEYVAILEDTIKKFEAEIYQLKTKLNVYEQNEKFKMVTQKDSIFSYLAGRDELYNKLQDLTEQYEQSKQNNEDLEKYNTKIDECVDMMQYRHGSMGVVRRQTISYLFKKILEKLVPSHMRYLTYSCLKENGYFQKIRGRKLAKSDNPVKARGKYGDLIEKASDPEHHIWKEAITEVGLNEEQIRSLKKAKAPIMKVRDKICKEMQKFCEIKKKILKLSKEIEHMIDKNVTKTLPIQRAKFLLYIDKVKHKKELSVFELWGVKRNKYKIYKKYKKGSENFPLIHKDYSDLSLKKRKEVEKNDEPGDVQMAQAVEKNDEHSEGKREKRFSQDSLESKEYEWHNYFYDQLQSSDDSGCPESSDEEIEE